MGRSHAASLDYRFWDKKGVNLALGGRDLASIRYQLEFLVPELINLKEVIIFITYSTFYFDNEALSDGNLNDARKALYYAIPSYKIIDYKDISNFVMGKFFPFIQEDHGYSLLKRKASSKNLKNIINVWTNWQENYMDSVEILQSAKKQASLHSSDRIVSERYMPNVVEKNKLILIDIVKYLKEKNINCLLVTSPYYHSYTDEFPKKDIVEMHNIVNQIKNEHKVKYFDFSRDTTFTYNNKYFHNADHLNDEGKRIFTEKFKAIKNLN